MSDAKLTRRALLGGAVAAGVAAGAPALGSLLLAQTRNGAVLDQGLDSVDLAPRKLRGYGTVSAVFRRSSLSNGAGSVLQINCEDGAKALLTHAKYLSDLVSLPGVEPTTMPVAGAAIPGFRCAGGGSIAAYASQSTVYVLAALSAGDLAALLTQHLSADARASDFSARAQVPAYLDRFDRHGLLAYYTPFKEPPGRARTDPPYDYNEDFAFAADNELGLVFWANEAKNDSAEGLTNSPVWEWAARECRARGLPVHINLLWGPALWLTNRYRNQTMQKQPQYCGNFYRIGDADVSSPGMLSWVSQEGADVELGILQEIVRRSSAADNIIGWLEPHGESDSPPQSLLVEYGDVADSSYRRFLQGRYRTPPELGKAWFGDAHRVSTWDDVRVPELASFQGWGADALDLTGEWKIQYLTAPDGHRYTREEARSFGNKPVPVVQTPPEWLQGGFNDGAWETVRLPGNDEQIFLVQSPVVLRRTLTVTSAWLETHPRQWLFLWDLIWSNVIGESYPVYVNGQAVNAMSRARPHWGAAEITGFLKSGANSIVICLPKGFVGYRCYVAPHAPVQYPALGAGLNAQWCDFIDWSRFARASAIRRGTAMIRQVDRERPINFMHPDFYSDLISGICVDYGGHFHNTGYMAAFWADYNALLARSAGRPVTAEPGGPANSAMEFQGYWGRWLTEGIQSVHYFQHLGDIQWNAAVRQAFEDNRAIYSAIGKYHVPRAEVAVLYGLRSNALTAWPWGADPNVNMAGGYWAWNAAYPLLTICPRDGVSEEDFEAGNAAKYRVVIDSNTSIMSEALVAKIEQYVRAGGTFVTFVQTGRHTPVSQNSWPIARITGYEVLRVGRYGDGNWAKESHALSLAPSQPVFQAAPWSGGVHGNGLSLRKSAAECQDLFLWDDGTVAAGMRQIGAGRVIHLGITFEPLGDRIKSPLTQALFEQILQYLKVARVPAQANDVIMRHYISNNGLFDIWALFNESDRAVTTTLTFSAPRVPAALKDMKTGQSVPVADSGGAVSASGLDLQPMESRLLLSPRARMEFAPLEWLAVQREWWSGTDTSSAAPLPTSAQDERHSMDLTDAWAFRAADGLGDASVASLMAGEVDESRWERRNLGIWTLPDHPDVKRAVLRRRFTVPSGWNGGETLLWVATAFGAPFRDRARIFLDGKLLRDFSAEGLNGVPASDLLRPGSTHVIAMDISGSGVLCGVTGSAWIYHIPDPASKMDLSGPWDLSDGTRSAGRTTFPGPMKALFAARLITVDAREQQRNALIYIRAEGPVFGVLINGEILCRYQNIVGQTFLIDVTAKLLFGRENRFELVSRDPNRVCQVQAIELRFYDRGTYG